MAGQMGSTKWHLPGVSELNQLQENVQNVPAAGGAANIVSVQQAGFMNKLRGYLQAQVVQTASTAAAAKSAWGTIGGSIRRLQVMVAGRKPFFSLSGLGLMMYNEVANPDGSVLAPPAYLVAAGDIVVAEGTHLTEHDAGGAAAQTYDVRGPFELQFGLPVWMAKLIPMGQDYIPIETSEQVGLWYLQERKTALTIDTDFFPAGVAVAGNPQAPYSSADIAATWSTTVNQLRWERELYDVPPDLTAWPDQNFVHQVVEYEATIAGSRWTFPIPQVGALLRAIFIILNGTPALVQWTDLIELTLTYGASDTPIARPGWALTHEFFEDYHRYPPAGVVVLDFYKAGREAARLALDTDRIANLAFNGRQTATATGQVRIILESLVPQNIEVA